MAYNQQPGVTGTIAGGGQYDDLDTVDSLQYNNAAATKAAEAYASAADAQVSEDNAEVSETNAATSETNAATSASQSANSATSSTNSATASAASASAALTSENNASDSENNAAASAAASATSATNSANSATASANSASASANSATASTNSATASANSASDSADSASAALVSENNAATSATNSANSAAASAASASNSASSATDAQSAQTAAETAETNAATSETNAATSASNASGSAATATTQATNAATSASNALTSANNASTSASSASGSAISAASSAANAALAYDSFDDRYLGSKTSAPTLDNDGNPLISGALYYNDGTVTPDDKGMWVYDSAAWVAASSASQAILTIYNYTATAGQTSFSGNDDNSNPLTYTVGSIIVTLNGIFIEGGTDYTATDGTSIVLSPAAAVNDELNVYVYNTFDAANVYALGDTRYATVAQGALADTSVQPADLATVATTGSYTNLINQPTLGTAAATASTDYATATQGATADTAVQPNDTATLTGLTLSGGTANGVTYLNGSKVLTSGSALTFDGSSLGIGVSPTQRLTIGGSADAQMTLRSNTTTGGSEIYFGDSDAVFRGLIAYAHSDDTMRFYTSGSEKMRLTSTGLGIGTSSPSVKLEIKAGNGDQLVLDNAGETYTQMGFKTNGIARGTIWASATDFSLYTYSTQPIVFYTNTAERLRIDSSGNVGIGISSPAAPLDVYKASQGGTATFRAYGPAGQILWANGGTSTSYLDSDTIVFRRSSDGGNTERMRIDSSGNVGIGTSSPASYARLSVSGTAGDQTGANQQLVISAPTTTAGQGAGIRLNAASGAKEAVSIIGVVNEASGNAGAMTFHVYDLGPVIPERMRIDSSGNLGLGVTPSAWLPLGSGGPILQIQNAAFFGSASTTGVLNNAYYNGGFKYISSDYASWYEQIDSKHVWYTAPSGTAGNAISFTQAMTLTAAGNLLVNDTSAQYSAKLYVNGSIAARHSGVDGNYQNAFVAGYTGNYTEKNIIQTAVSSSGVGSGFRFLTSDGAGLSTTKTTLDVTRDRIVFYNNGTERMRLDSGNLLVGTTSPDFSSSGRGLVEIAGSSNALLSLKGGSALAYIHNTGTNLNIQNNSAGALLLGTNSAERMRIDSAGRVTMPYQPSFKAGRSGSYTPGANADIVFNDVSSGSTHHNNGGHYSTSTGRFTAPVAGVYMFSALVIYQELVDGAPADDLFYIRKNGGTATYSFRRGEYVNGITGNAGYYVDSANIILSLAASDYVNVSNGRFNYTVHGNSQYCWFSGHLLG